MGTTGLFLLLNLIFINNYFANGIPIIPGSARLCNTGNATILGFEVLPGSGWDNLVNENRGRIVSYNYSTCSTTEDGLYLVPNGINTVPIKSSSVKIYSERFDHWMNYTSDTSRAINVGGDASIAGVFHIGGKFSREYEEVKSNQVNDDSFTVRVGAKYEMYTAKLAQGVVLDPIFRNKVIDIAHHIQFDRKDTARYESQLLIRDFGTHVITSVGAGAMINRVDSVNKSLVTDSAMTKSEIGLAASFSFFGKGIDFGSSKTVTDTLVTQYAQSRTHSTVRSHGGPIYKPLNFSVNDWATDIDNNLVAIDRAGDPLHFLITSELFPELPVSTLAQVGNTIEQAIASYYKFNTHKGCTKLDSPNFNFHANVDDGSCEMPGSNLSLGGMFQNCTFEGDTTNLCETRTTTNPKTGALTCPEGYDAVLLYRGNVSATEIDHQCEGFMIFWKKCHDSPRYGSAQYNTYWCAAHAQEAPPKSGYLFGGVYDNIKVNPLTQDHSCPQYFYPLPVADELKVCVSDDFENGEHLSVPFGGLFSCQYGNPLANKYYTPANQPKTCPDGYSQHLATIDMECEINYCALINAFSGLNSLPVKTPPFVKRPKERNDTESYIITENERSWTRIYSVPNNFTGFNGIVNSWVLDDGGYLDIASLLNSKEKKEPVAIKEQLAGNRKSFAPSPYQEKVKETFVPQITAQEFAADTVNGNDDTRSLTKTEILAIAGVSCMITLFCVLFVAILIVFYHKITK